MSTEGSAIDDTVAIQPPAKRQRTLACRRCRHRKQKCEDGRPCTNCLRSGEECIPMAPAIRPNIEPDYVRVLEERIAELESLDPQQSLDHVVHDNFPPQERRESRTTTGSSVCHAFAADHESPGFDHLILGLAASPSTQPASSPIAINAPPNDPLQQALPSRIGLPDELDSLLVNAYRERAQPQYPFFYWNHFLSWHDAWNAGEATEETNEAWHGFFVHLVHATALLLLRRSQAGRYTAGTLYRRGLAILPAVLKQPDKILHVQAYLLLTIHALHQSSTERIISLASTTMRYCIQQQLHIADTEPQPIDVAMRLQVQIRRRCFWCAYKLDRLVMASYDLPCCVPDSMITTKPYANISDKDLLEVATNTPAECELPDSPSYTCVSSSLHILQCRRIQSEISAITLRSDYATHYDTVQDWRIRILSELDCYKTRAQKFSDPDSKGYTSQRWLAMIYNYTLLMLHRPTRESVLGPAGDWSVQASSQACLMFRKTQKDRQVAHPWLGLLVQFQSGITLLYCFWATPPTQRTESYESLDVPDALRACSNTLAIMADRWSKADCLRDVFELLAREIPLVDRPNRPPTRLSDKTIEIIQNKLPQIRSLVVHRSILRMIEEMLTHGFQRHFHDSLGLLDAPTSVLANRRDHSMFTSTSTSNSFNFQLPFSTEQEYTFSGNLGNLESLASDGLLSFPSVFDFESWR